MNPHQQQQISIPKVVSKGFQSDHSLIQPQLNIVPFDQTGVAAERDSSKTIQDQQYLAYIHAIISACAIVIVQLCVKKLSIFFPAPLILGLRGSLLFILNFFIMKYKSVSMDVKDPINYRLVVKRSIFSSLTMTTYMVPIQYIEIGVAAALFNTGPLFTFFIEALYYKKISIKWIHVFITFICFCGVLLIIQPQFIFGGMENKISKSQSILYGVVLFSACCSSFSMIFIHDLRHSLNQNVTLQYGYIFQGSSNYLLFSILSAKYHGGNDQYVEFTFPLFWEFFILLILLVASAYLTQYTRVRSMYLSKPSKAMPFSYISVILGMVVDVLIFDAKYNWYMIIGAICTSIGLLSKVLIKN